MAEQIVEALVAGGKASAAPPLGPALGPLGVNIGQVVAEINKKTADFKGMQVPVKVIVDTDDKSFTITIGTPPASSLIKKEAGVQKGSGNPKVDLVADLKMEQIIKVAKMKFDALLGKNMVQKVREILGTCQSMGIMVEGKPAYDILQEMNTGAYTDIIKSGKTELTAEELKAQDVERKKLAGELEEKRKQYEAISKQILEKFKNASRNAIKSKLIDAGIPSAYVDQFLPADEKTK
jgi:large subunit ribosomal protein L11